MLQQMRDLGEGAEKNIMSRWRDPLRWAGGIKRCMLYIHYEGGAGVAVDMWAAKGIEPTGAIASPTSPINPSDGRSLVTLKDPQNQMPKCPPKRH